MDCFLARINLTQQFENIAHHNILTGRFYRVENQLLLQGIISEDSVPKNTILGPCPDYAKYQNHATKCPAHDPNCGCHGPVMTNGMVGWAGGTGGPDFFITTSVSPLILSSDVST